MRVTVWTEIPLPQSFEQGIGEVQARGRRRDRPFGLREHGLVIRAILIVGRAPGCDVGRQRHCAALVDRLIEHRSMEREGERHLPALAFVLDGGIELAQEADPAFLAEAHDIAGRQPLGGLHEGAPARAVDAAVQRGLDRRLHGAAPDAPAAQPRRDHLGVVDDERVPGTQQIREIAHDSILEIGAGTDHQQPCRIARYRRAQGNPFGEDQSRTGQYACPFIQGRG